MLHFSFSSTYTAIMTGSVLLLLILLLCQDRIIQKVGYRVLFFLSCLTLLRFVFPFELPFTITKHFPSSVSYIVSSFRVALLETRFFTLSLWSILEIIWLIGIIVSFILNILQERRMRKYVFRYGRDVTEQAEYSLLLEQICLSEKRQNRFRIYKLPGLQAPVIWKNRRVPYILLPDSLHLSQEDMCFVFRHETAHYFHGDFLFKGMIRLICIIYWWNPICIVLKRRVEMLLEMRVDHYAAGENILVSQQYIQCLAKLLQNVSIQLDATPKPSYSTAAISFFSGDVGELEKRAKMLLDAPSHKHYPLVKALTLFAALGVFVLSYLYILEAYYLLPEIVENNYVILDSENSYIIQTGENTYEIYYQGEYYYTTDSLDYYDKNTKIYTMEELPYDN